MKKLLMLGILFIIYINVAMAADIDILNWTVWNTTIGNSNTFVNDTIGSRDGTGTGVIFVDDRPVGTIGRVGYYNISQGDNISLSYSDTHTEFTASMWVKVNSGSSLIGGDHSPGGCALEWGVQRSGTTINAYVDQIFNGVQATGVDLTTWSMLTITYNGSVVANHSRLKIYHNYTDTAATGFGDIPATVDVTIFQVPVIQNSGCSMAGFNGYLGQVVYYNRTLSQTEIQALYEQSYGTDYIYILDFYNKSLPDNSTITSNSIYYYDIYGTNSTIPSSCDVYVNGIKKINQNTTTALDNSFTYQLSYGTQGYNTINLTCSNTITSQTYSQNKTVFVDNVLPNIIYINKTIGTDSTAINDDVFTSNYTTLNISYAANDTHLYQVNMTIYLNGSSKSEYSIQATGITETQFSNFSLIDFSGIASGYYEVNVTAWDAHTLSRVDFNKYLIQKEYLTALYRGKEFDRRIRTYAYRSAIEQFDLINTYDRKKFDITFVKDVTAFSMFVEGNEKVDYVGKQYGYLGHFIIDNKYWLDLENSKRVRVARVVKISDTKYRIDMVKPKLVRRVVFNSIGLINKVSSKANFFFLVTNVTLNFYDETTQASISHINLTAQTGSTTNNYNTTGGNITINNVGLDRYTLSYESGITYPTRITVIDDLYTYNNLSLYLVPLSKLVDQPIIVYDELENGLSGAEVSVYRTINGLSVLVQRQICDSGGATLFNLQSGASYSYSVSRTGYNTETGTLTATGDTLNIYMELIGGVYNALISGVTANYYPKDKILLNLTNYTFTINISSTINDLTGCWFYIYNGTSSLTSLDATTSITFCNASINYNTGNYSDFYTRMVYEINSSTNYSYEVPYKIEYSYVGNFSLKTLIDDITAFSHSGFNNEGRIIIGFLFILIIVGFVSDRVGFTDNTEGQILVALGLIFVISWTGWFTLTYSQIPNYLYLRKYFIFVLASIVGMSYIVSKHNRE